VQIPILNGIYTAANSDIRTSYPRNLVPVPKDSNISQGYLRPADGITTLGTYAAVDRGGINWKGTCYRVMGTKLVSISSTGVKTEIGDVQSDGKPVLMDYSFTYLAIMSNAKLWLYNGTTLTQVTDVDLGTVLSFIWIDGYFMTTDGTNLVVTELNDPFAVNPLKYGSSEIDPDSIVAVLKLRDEVYALNRNTIEVFNNTGGTNFPFTRNTGALIAKGCIGSRACCVFADSIAFLGSSRNEAPSIYLAKNGQYQRIATREIDQILSNYTETQLASVVFEVRVDSGHNHLWIRLPDQTLVYDVNASQTLSTPVWFTLTSGTGTTGLYRAQNLVYCYDKWIVGDPTTNKLGYLDDTHSNHYGDVTTWDFGTTIIYNAGNGAIFNSLELICLSGRNALGTNPQISTEYSLDGLVWSNPKFISAGKQGDRVKRLVWFRQGQMQHWRVQRFSGDSNAYLSIIRIEASIEPLQA